MELLVWERMAAFARLGYRFAEEEHKAKQSS
jgi:hypothetical protein